MNKRGVTGEALLIFFKIMALVIAVFILINMFEQTIKANLEIGDLRYYPHATRILYSKDCVTDQPGVIILEKFKQENIKSCMADIPYPVAARFTLNYMGEKSIYHNEDTYYDMKPLAFSQRYRIMLKRFFVLVDDGGEVKPANMVVEVIWRK